MEVKGKEIQKGTKIEFDSPVSSLFLEVIGAENGHRSVCLKLSGLETNKSKSLVVKTCTSKAFQKLTKNEMMFYEHIAPHVKSLQLPACYSIHKDSLTIVLEDLTERFCTKDIWSDFSQTQILLCVKSLAMFHAEQSRPLKDGKYDHLPLVKVSDDEFILYWQTRFDNSLQHLKSSRKDVFKPEFMSFLSKFQRAQDKLMKLPAKHSTLIHYDAFIGNWMFDSSALPFTKEDVLTKDVDPRPHVRLIDWQTVCTGPGTIDLATLLFAAHQSREFDEVAKKLYFDTLVSSGVSEYSEKDFEHDWKIGELISMIQLSSFFFAMMKDRKMYKREDIFEYYDLKAYELQESDLIDSLSSSPSCLCSSKQ